MMEPADQVTRELTRGLAPVPAPPELWSRVDAALNRRPEHRARPIPWAYAVAAAGVAVVVVAVVLFGQASVPAISTLTAAHQELTAHPASLAVLADNAVPLRRWLAGAGFELTPAVSPRDGVTLIGATVLHRGGHAFAALHYRARGVPATLFIRAANDGPERPKSVLEASSAGVTTYQWRAHGQEFVLAVSSSHEARRACALCHADVAG